MPRSSRGAYLWLRRDAKSRGGSTWIIREGRRHYRTGCGALQREEAERKLADHIASKYSAPRRERDLAQIPIADVLTIYASDVVPGQVRPEKAAERIDRLLDFWGTKTLDQVNGSSCREYVSFRARAERERGRKRRSDTDAAGGAKRDLEDLRAAINHHGKEGLHRGLVRVALPDRGKPRQRWLTRSEAARLLWTCWRAREVQDGVETKKRPLRHLVRFLLVGLYTGSRPGAILTAAWDQGPKRSWVDVDRTLFYRLAEGNRETAKRQPPVPIAPRLAAHLRRWRKMDGGQGYVVTYNGAPIASVKTAMSTAVTAARLKGMISAYTLRHTAATWLMHADVSIWMAARFLGTSPEIIEKTYAHHAPSYLAEAAEALGSRSRSAK